MRTSLSSSFPEITEWGGRLFPNINEIAVIKNMENCKLKYGKLLAAGAKIFTILALL